MALNSKQQRTRNEYSESTKAAAMAALLTGQGVDKVAEQYNIPATTLYSWKSKHKNGDGIVNLASQKKEKIGDLLLEYLNASLITLRAQVEFFRDETWLSKQDASSAATLHGVTTDKAIRLLEALSRSQESEDTEDETE